MSSTTPRAHFQISVPSRCQKLIWVSQSNLVKRTKWAQSTQGLKRCKTPICMRDKCHESHQPRWLCWPHWPWQAALSSEINLSTKLKGRKGRKARTQISIPTPSAITDVSPGVGGINHTSLVCSWGQLSFQPFQPVPGSVPPAVHLPLATNPQLSDRHGCRLSLTTRKATVYPLEPGLWRGKTWCHAILPGVYFSNLFNAPSTETLPIRWSLPGDFMRI